MIVPNKFIPLKESVLGKLEYVLTNLTKEMSVDELHTKAGKYFCGIDEFIYALDVLFILGSLELDSVTRTLKHVKRDQQR